MFDDISKEQVWSQALSHFEKTLGPDRFKATFSRTRTISLEDGVLTIATPNEFDKTWIMGSYYDLTTETVSSILGSQTEIVIKVDESIVEKQLSNEPITEEEIEEAVFSYEQASDFKQSSQQTSQQQLNPTRETNTSKQIRTKFGFNPRYSFDSFIIGDSNSFAQSAALAVAESPGLKYNPLFIWGDSGLGKTHLLHAIGSYIHQNYPSKNVIYVTAEQFSEAFVMSVQKDTIQEFKDLFRLADVLLIDDIQFIEGKTGTIEQIFHTFNYLKEKGNQIVLAADRAPKEIDLDDRITSRFRSGLEVDVQPPTYEVRLAIIRQFLKNERFTFDREAESFVAEHSSGNIRELEGILTRIIAFSGLSKVNHASLDLVKKVTVDMFNQQESKPISIIEIQKEVARYYKVTQLDMVGVKRTQNIVQARHVAMYLSQELTDKSLNQIGREFGKKDHTTVLHAVAKINKNMSKDKDLYNTISLLTARLKG